LTKPSNGEETEESATVYTSDKQERVQMNLDDNTPTRENVVEKMTAFMNVLSSNDIAFLTGMASLEGHETNEEQKEAKE
jgi:hypothetical protein